MPLQDVGEIMVYNDSEIKKTIGNNIKVYRKLNLKVSREKFIDGVTDKFASIENIETGKSYPDLRFIVRVSNKYNVPVKLFIDTGYRGNKTTDEEEIFAGYSENETYSILCQMSMEKYSVLRRMEVSDNTGTVQNSGEELCMDSIGRILRNERIKRNITQDSFAEMAGVAKKTIMNIETCNNKGISVKTLYRLCAALKVPMDYILSEKLNDKREAIKYMITDIFRDTDEREKNFLKEYARIVGEYVKR